MWTHALLIVRVFSARRAVRDSAEPRSATPRERQEPGRGVARRPSASERTEQREGVECSGSVKEEGGLSYGEVRGDWHRRSGRHNLNSALRSARRAEDSS